MAPFKWGWGVARILNSKVLRFNYFFWHKYSMRAMYFFFIFRDQASKTRKWGGGMANAGRSKTSDVPKTHFGPITGNCWICFHFKLRFNVSTVGVEVGMCWKNRIQVSEVGIHLPHVAGMSGQKDVGSQSIVLAGGYEDDRDDGFEFTYTGCGGRDLSGNKRTGVQSFDQV